MKIVVVGAGAMGSLYGALLSTVAGTEVWLLDVWAEHVEAINRDGVIMEEPDGIHSYRNVRAVTNAKEIGEADLAVIFVKSTLTKKAMEESKAVFGEKTLVLSLQNGLGNIEQMASVVNEGNILAGTTAHGATMLGPGKIRHAGRGKTILGEPDGCRTGRVQETAALFEKAGLETEISENVIGLIWDKLLVNVGINALTVITRLQNGKLLEHPEIIALLEAAVKEAAAVAAASGIKLGFADPVAHAKEVCAATSQNKSSMLQDVLNGRKTEIDRINGVIVREGEKYGVPAPVNFALTNLVKFIEGEAK
ncbi:2-dehydropantoate 2-reductase [Clostridia bacterium]|nr:2-dehydropantoate 2-reductase [Clostridia bacterium]